MKTFLRICVFLAVFIAARIVFSALQSGSGVAAGDILARLVQIDGLQLVGSKISGQLSNLGSSRLDTVFIRFNTYTRDGAKLGETSDMVTKLDGRERWAFRAYAGSEARTYAIAELRVNGLRVPVRDMEVHYAGEETKEDKDRKAANAAAERERAAEEQRREAEAKVAEAKQVADAKVAKQAKIDAAVKKFREWQKEKASKEANP